MRLGKNPSKETKLTAIIIANKGRLPQATWDGHDMLTKGEIKALLNQWHKDLRWDYVTSLRAGWLCVDGEAVFE